MNDVLSVVGTVATVPGIIAITNLAKGLGLSGRWSALVAVVLGVVLSVGQWAFADQGWWGAATTGLLLGLGAAGLYDLTPSSKTAAASDGLPDGVSAGDVGTPAPSVGVDPAPAAKTVQAETAKTAATPAAGLPDATTAPAAAAQAAAQAATTPAAATAAAAPAAAAATNATA